MGSLAPLLSFTPHSGLGLVVYAPGLPQSIPAPTDAGAQNHQDRSALVWTRSTPESETAVLDLRDKARQM